MDVTDIDVVRLQQIYLETNAELISARSILQYLERENDHLRSLIDLLVKNINNKDN